MTVFEWEAIWRWTDEHLDGLPKGCDAQFSHKNIDTCRFFLVLRAANINKTVTQVIVSRYVKVTFMFLITFCTFFNPRSFRLDITEWAWQHPLKRARRKQHRSPSEMSSSRITVEILANLLCLPSPAAPQNALSFVPIEIFAGLSAAGGCRFSKANNRKQQRRRVENFEMGKATRTDERSKQQL